MEGQAHQAHPTLRLALSFRHAEAPPLAIVPNAGWLAAEGGRGRGGWFLPSFPWRQ
jgi:hypothetical protein